MRWFFFFVICAVLFSGNVSAKHEEDQTKYWSPLNPEYKEGRTVFCSGSMSNKAVYQRGWE